MTTITMSVEREDTDGTSHEIELRVTGTHNPYVPARLHGHPDNSTPAEGGDTEIESVTVLNHPLAHLFTALTDDEEEKAKESIEESATDDSSAEYEREHDDAPDYYDD